MLLNVLKNNEVDKCIYVKNIDEYLILCRYVDNMFILDNNDYTIKFNKKIFTNKFKILGCCRCNTKNKNYIDLMD